MAWSATWWSARRRLPQLGPLMTSGTWGEDEAQVLVELSPLNPHLELIIDNCL
jgi:hypothetical protein